ncbi:hypothetical protein NL676_004362 [Syzygium grande]|nr:hypothetical protein NL676_004362 [Syzygium grande]
MEGKHYLLISEGKSRGGIRAFISDLGIGGEGHSILPATWWTELLSSDHRRRSLRLPSLSLSLLVRARRFAVPPPATESAVPPLRRCRLIEMLLGKRCGTC